jgi:hypothetical protein
MFEKYVIVPGSLHNLADSGYTLDLRIPYYRGLGLSMVDVDLTVDGKAVPRERIRFSVHGREFMLADLALHPEERWGFHEPATLTVAGDSLDAGEHTVEASIHLRVSYLPVPSVTKATAALAVS